MQHYPTSSMAQWSREAAKTIDPNPNYEGKPATSNTRRGSLEDYRTSAMEAMKSLDQQNYFLEQDANTNDATCTR